MKKIILGVMFFGFFNFSTSLLAYDTCDPYDPDNLPCQCSFNSYILDSFLGVEDRIAFYSSVSTTVNDTDEPGYWTLITTTPYYSYGMDYYYSSIGDWASPSYHGPNGVAYFDKTNNLIWYGEGAAQLTINFYPEDSGTVSLSPPGGNYAPDTEVELTAIPEEGYEFAYFDDGTTCYYDNPWTVTMDENKEVTAVFNWNIKLPLPGDKNWLLYVEPGGGIQCNGGTDQYHTGTNYYAFDFTDNTLEDGHLEGTDVPILAAAGGTVIYAGNDNDWGYTVVIDHSNGYKTRYAHLKYDPTVSGTVTQGQQIGVMGSTGNSSGIHLHFQIYYDGYNSSLTNEGLAWVKLDGLSLDDYQVGCSNDNPPTGFYYSSNL